MMNLFLLLSLFTFNSSADTKFEKINESYKSQIKPIFQKKCFDCHSDQTHYPWYYKLPLIRSMIDEDIEEGREHLDMSHDFPFQSKNMDFLEYMDELKEVVENGEMPLLSYRLIHWGTALTKPESDQIVKWVNDSLWLFKDDQKTKKK